MALTSEDYKRIREQAQQTVQENQAKRQQQQNMPVGSKPTEYKVWSDKLGNVNISNLSTGETERRHQWLGSPLKDASKDSLGADLGQSVSGAFTGEFGGVKSALATGGLAIAGLLHGDNHYEPEVGSWLWRMQEGGEAAKKASSKLAQDASYGRGKLGQFAMNLTGAASTFALERALDFALPGAGTALMYTSAGGNAAEDARQRGLSITSQLLKGVKTGGAAWATENLSKVSGLPGAGGEGLIDGLINKGAAKIADKGGNVVLYKIATGMASEGAEEILEDYFNHWGDIFLKHVAKGDYDIEELPDAVEIIYDGLIGSILGGFGSVSTVAQYNSDSKKAAENGMTYGDYTRQNMEAKRSAAISEKVEKWGRRINSAKNLKAALTSAGEYVKDVFDGAAAIAKAEEKAAPPESPEIAAQEPLVADQQTTPEVAPLAPDAASPEFNSKQESSTRDAAQFLADLAEESTIQSPVNTNVETAASPRQAAIERGAESVTQPAAEPVSEPVAAPSVEPIAEVPNGEAAVEGAPVQEAAISQEERDDALRELVESPINWFSKRNFDSAFAKAVFGDYYRQIMSLEEEYGNLLDEETSLERKLFRSKKDRARLKEIRNREIQILREEKALFRKAYLNADSGHSAEERVRRLRELIDDPNVAFIVIVDDEDADWLFGDNYERAKQLSEEYLDVMFERQAIVKTFTDSVMQNLTVAASNYLNEFTSKSERVQSEVDSLLRDTLADAEKDAKAEAERAKTAPRQLTEDERAELEEWFNGGKESRETLEEVSRWGQNEPKPVEDLTGALEDNQNLEEIESIRAQQAAEAETRGEQSGAEILADAAQNRQEKKKAKKQRGKRKSAADVALDEYAKDTQRARERAEGQGVDVEADDFNDEQEPKTKKSSEQKPQKSGAEILVEARDQAKTRKTAEKKKSSKEGRAKENAEFDEKVDRAIKDALRRSVDRKSPDNKPAGELFSIEMDSDSPNARQSAVYEAVNRFVDKQLNKPYNTREEKLARLTKPGDDGLSRLDKFVDWYLNERSNEAPGEAVDKAAEAAEDKSSERKAQMVEEGRQERLAHRLTSEMTVEDIAEAISSQLDPSKGNQTITVRAKDAVRGPYSLNVFVPTETVENSKGEKTTIPRSGADYTFRLFHTDAKTGTAVRVFKGSSANLDAVANRVANIINDYESGTISGQEAVMKLTRGEIVKRLNEQRAKNYSDENALVKDSAPNYEGDYKIGDFTAHVKKSTTSQKGRTFLRGYEISVDYNGDAVVQPHTVSVKSNPLQALATDIESANFEVGNQYDFGQDNTSYKVRTNKGKSTVTSPEGNVTTALTESPIDAVNESRGENGEAEEDLPWYQDLTDKDIVYSQEHPETVTIDGTDYEVRVQWANTSKTSVEYVVTQAGDEDVEARIGLSKSREDWDASDAAQYAVAHPRIWDNPSAEDVEAEERSTNGEENESGDSAGTGQSEEDIAPWESREEKGESGRTVRAVPGGLGTSSPAARGIERGGTEEKAARLGKLIEDTDVDENARNEAKEFGDDAFIVKHDSLNEGQKSATAFLEKLTGKKVYWVAHNRAKAINGMCDLDGNIYISATRRISKLSGIATGIHETLHQRVFEKAGNADDADKMAAGIADKAFSSLAQEERDDMYYLYAKKMYKRWFGKDAPSKSAVLALLKSDNPFSNRTKHETLAAYVGGSTILYGKTLQQIDKLQTLARRAVVDADLFKRSDFFGTPYASEVYSAMKAAKKVGNNFFDDEADSTASSEESDVPFTMGEETEEAQSEDNEKLAKTTFGAKGLDKVKASVKNLADVKTFFDTDEFRASTKRTDANTRNRLDKFRALFNAAANGSVNIDELLNYYSGMKNDDGLSNFWNEDVQRAIDTYRGMVDKNLDTYNEAASKYAATRIMEMMAHKFQQANEYAATLRKMNETLGNAKNGALRKLAKSDKLMASVARALYRWQVNPETVFKMIDSFDKGKFGEGYKLAKELEQAHREKYKVMSKARSHFLEVSAMDGYEDFIYGKEKVKDYTGREWDARDALKAVKSIDTIRSTSGKKLGDTDGFGIVRADGEIDYIDMNDIDAAKLRESLWNGLSDTAKAYSKAVDAAMAEVKEPLRQKRMENDGIEVSMIGDSNELFEKSGLEKAVYFPLEYVTDSGETFEWDITKQNNYSTLPRFMQERSDSGKNYILIRPVTETVDSYFQQASNYLAYSAYNNKIVGLARGSKYMPGLASSLANAYGKDMGNWYRSYLEDLQSYSAEDDVEGINSLLRQGRQKLQQGALLFSVSVPMKQISSYWAASGILHPDSLIKSYRLKLLKPKNKSNVDYMLESRGMGNLEMSAAEAANEAKKMLGKLKHGSGFIKFMANAINQMDYNTVSNLYDACKYDVLKYQFNGDQSVVGTDEYASAVEEKFQEVVDRSQPNFDKQMRAEYGRTDNELVRMLSMFRTQQTQNLNLLATALGEYKAAKGTERSAEATRTLKETIAGQAASALSLSMLTILADMLLHRQKKYEDDEKELDPAKILTRLGINAAEAAAGTMWFGDSIAKWAIDKISGGKTKEFYGVNMGVISTTTDILENFENFIKNPSRSNARYCAGNIATLLGVPLNNAYSMLNSAIMYAKDITGTNSGDYDDILKYLDAQAKAAKKAEEKEKKKSGSSTGATMLAETAQKNAPKENGDSKSEAENVPTYMKKPYKALVDSGLSDEQSRKMLDFMDTDDNDSIKQSEVLGFYKDNPQYEAFAEAIWEAQGWKTSWEKGKKKVG